ncbi:MAG: enoyl-CoA hydratase/isomerase family protein [Ottowia sp.]|uniref:enoyl-CoA hydratase/isomerase family protein n=1 Tax=Ottowia sp. TaxID=1898956 RepID=UPI003C70F22B
MPSPETLILTEHEGVVRVTLNRPAVMNAISRQMADEFADTLLALQQRKDVRALVLHGAGGNFCAGGDVKGMHKAGPRGVGEAREGMARYLRMTKALRDFDRPVIAAADGVAFGAGFSLLLLADMVLLGERARLSMVFGRVGLIPDCGALYTLPRVVGVQRAKEIVFSARELHATEAHALGLAMEVLTSDALLDRATAIASSLCYASPLALASAKGILDQSLNCTLDDLLEQEADAQAMALASDYHREAVNRFTARKPPLFAWPGSVGDA